jgi:acyl-CoA synthetase (NDP forming)
MAPAFPHRQILQPLLCPQSVAIIGISQLPRFGGWLYQNLQNLGYRGRIDLVNPRYAQLFGRACYPSLREVPVAPECAILAVPNDRLLRALEDAASVGVKAAIIPGSAYAQPVPGQPSLQDRLEQVARDAGMAVCGPNGMGLISFANRFCATGYPVSPGLEAGHVAFITHSGTVFDSLWQNTRGLRFNYLVSSGNEIATTLADYLQFALEDSATRAIGLFLETVRDPATFRAALAEAAERDVPVAALKVGRSARGAELAQTHSGAVAGDDAVYDAVFAQYGVQRVQSLDEMLDTLELFAAGLRPPTRYITSIHDSGGQRGLLVDLAEVAGVAFGPIDEATTARLAEIIEPGLAPTNPLDAWGTGNDFGRIFSEAMLALDSDPSTGLNVWVADLYAAGSVSQTYALQAIDHRHRFSKPLVFLANIAAAVDAAQAQRLRAAGIPVLLGTENGLRAIGHLLAYAEFQRERQRPAEAAHALLAPPSPAQVAALRAQLAAATAPLDEFASTVILRGYGLPAPAEAAATSLADAMQAAKTIGYPVALKTAAGTLHKSDQGGVHLNLPDLAALTRAYRALADRFGPRVLVQKMAHRAWRLSLEWWSTRSLGRC